MSLRGEKFHFGIPFGLFRLDDIVSRCSFPKVVDYIVNIFRIEELEKCSVETSVLEPSNKSFHKVIFISTCIPDTLIR